MLLVNGRDSSTVTLPVANGAIQNWYIVNAANTTFARLEISQHSVLGGPGIREDTWEIGSDGGYIEYPYKRIDVDSTAPPPTEHPGQALIAAMHSGVLLFPGERMQVAFTPSGQDGETFTIQQWDWFRGRHLAVWNPTMTQIMLPDDPLDGAYPTVDFFDITLTGNDPGTGEWVPNFLLPFPPLAAPYGLQAPSLPVTFGHGLPDPSSGDVTLFAQAHFGDDGGMTPLPSQKIESFAAHDVKVGDVKKWEVANLTHGDHPFHTHGFFFELIEYQWVDGMNPTSNFKWQPLRNNVQQSTHSPKPRKRKDTIRIPARLGAKGSSKTIARLRVVFDDTGREGQAVAEGGIPTFDKNGNYTAGGWLFHCHVLEHSAKGMLSFFEVRDPSSAFSNLGQHLPGATTPYLTGTGSPATGVTLDLVNALPSTLMRLVHSNQLARSPFFGGTLVPQWGHNTFTFVSDPQGEVVWNIAAGQVDKFWQVVYRDPAAPQGWSMSNALLIQ